MYLRSVLPRSETEVNTPRARNHVALDLGKPEFDLIQPRRVGWREMKTHFRMFGKGPLDIFGLVRGKIIKHQADLVRMLGPLHEPFQKGDELAAGVPRRRHAVHRAGLHIERRVQRQRAVPIVSETMPLGAARGKGRPGSRRSNAWIAVFSSTQNTAVCCGGFIYSR
jgi:hypothetical protein